MDPKFDDIYHVVTLLILSVGVFSLGRLSTIVVLMIVPILGEIVQYFVPGRTPDVKDIVHGYLGILVGYCSVRLWREIKPVAKKVLVCLKERLDEHR